MIYRLSIITLALLIIVTLFSCRTQGEGARSRAELNVEDESMVAEGFTLPEDFPIYPGAVYTHHSTMEGSDVYEFTSIDSPELLAENYMEILREKGYEVSGEALDKYLDLQVAREGQSYAFIEGELKDTQTRIRIRFAPEQ